MKGEFNNSVVQFNMAVVFVRGLRYQVCFQKCFLRAAKVSSFGGLVSSAFSSKTSQDTGDENSARLQQKCRDKGGVGLGYIETTTKLGTM